MGEYYGIRMKDDPDGEYLQHWGLAKGAMRKGHKYLARLVTPSGYRYIYDQAQLAAAKLGKTVSRGLSDARRGAQSAAYSVRRTLRNATGIGLKSQAQRASARAQRMADRAKSNRAPGMPMRVSKARVHAKKVQSAYENSLLGRAEKAFSSARKNVSGQADKMYTAVRRAGKQAGKAIDNVVGGSAKKNLQRQQDRYTKALKSDAYFDMPDNGEKRRKMAQRDARIENAQRAYSKAEDRYGRTLMGIAEKARENAGRAISGAGKAVSDTGRQVDRVRKNVQRSVGNAARNIDNKYGLTGQGRHNKRNAEFKRKSIDRRYRTPSGMIDSNRETDAKAINNFNNSTRGASGYGAGNPYSGQAKRYLSNSVPSRQNTSSKRKKRNAQLRSTSQETRANSAGPSRRSSWTNSSVSSKRQAPKGHPGVDAALNLLRTGQGIDTYSINKRGGEYRKKLKKKRPAVRRT